MKRLTTKGPRSVVMSLAVGLAVVAMTGTSAVAAPDTAQTNSDVRCEEHRVPISQGALGKHEMSGTLCLPSKGSPDNVQILVPGSTYDHTYWDFPMKGYSYARYAAERGQATFAIDRFNTGNSARLPSAAVTVLGDAAAVHQIAGKLRAGDIGGTKYDQVVTVGHSLGSIIVLQEASQYKDVDGVVLTGFTHTPSAKFIADLATGKVLQPAPMASPRLKKQPTGDLGANYESRKRNFYAPDNSDPAVIKEDYKLGSVITLGELATFPLPTYGPQSEQVTAPVLMAMGSKDSVFFCGLGPCKDMKTLRASEEHRFPRAKSIDFSMLPGSGHNLNLALNRTEYFRSTSDWVEKITG